MKTKCIAFIFLVIVAIAGCVQQQEKPSDIMPPAPTFQSAQAVFSDEDILNSVYSDYNLPEAFYQDNLDKGDKIYDAIYYERQQENNKWIFYCTDQLGAAKQFVDEDVANYNKQEPAEFYPDRFIIETNENDKFFEFKTIEDQTKSSDIKYYLRYRVHKCSYLGDLQHGMYYKKDNTLPDNYVGVFTQKPVTTENVKELVEFLWYSAFGHYNTGGSKVLSSFSEDNDGFIKHILFETNSVFGDFGVCDQITLTKSTYTVNKNSGEIELTQEEIKNIQGICR
ncbi:MAG: hypothetical protein KAJ91_02665 [Candidatus Aenigmarchaeota archaeon]|nr:hypothetical protein [Candidatus Aenigmarchaeota archaeon]